MPTFNEMQAGYRNMWAGMKVRPDKRAALDKAARKIIDGRVRYQQVEAKTGVPWFMIGVIHYRESSCNFNTHLHNGDPLSKRTTRVPANRPKTGSPPFPWDESAIDALTMPPHQLNQIEEWPIERIGYELEKYNGWGYLGKTNSPYLWSGSNHYTSGKYIADHVFSREAVDAQMGTLVLIKVLSEIVQEVADRITAPSPIPLPPPPDIPPPEPAPKSIWETVKGWFS